MLTVIEAHRSRAAQHDIRDAASAAADTAEQGLSAVALVKAFARGHYETARYAATADQAAAARIRAARIRAVLPAGGDVLVAAGNATVIGVGAGQVLTGTLSVGSLVVFISYLASLYVPLQGLGRLTGTTSRALVGAERVIDLLDEATDHTERPGTTVLPTASGHLELRDVSFGYTPTRPVLHHIDLHLHPGEMLALAGPSGAGKTTLASLLLGFHQPDTGTVCLDSHPLPELDPTSARGHLAAVLQEPMLFDTTIAENIRYGRLEATDAELAAAATAAEAHELITALPEGYHTRVGPRGVNLSGGQRQRIALARALITPAPVLLLDEATSALDPDTETRVLSRLRHADPPRAILLIAHRPSALAHADRVLTLNHGHFVDHDNDPCAQLANQDTSPATANTAR